MSTTTTLCTTVFSVPASPVRSAPQFPPFTSSAAISPSDRSADTPQPPGLRPATALAAAASAAAGTSKPATAMFFPSWTADCGSSTLSATAAAMLAPSQPANLEVASAAKRTAVYLPGGRHSSSREEEKAR
jgi:hypothetical protein